jgi:hypothetical protein
VDVEICNSGHKENGTKYSDENGLKLREEPCVNVILGVPFREAFAHSSSLFTLYNMKVKILTNCLCEHSSVNVRRSVSRNWEFI